MDFFPSKLLEYVQSAHLVSVYSNISLTSSTVSVVDGALPLSWQVGLREAGHGEQVLDVCV